jgi:enamine deaminase RidA (YjgF/YER057c/UK114 family)
MIERTIAPGLHTVRLAHGGIRQYFITAVPNGGDDEPGALCERALSPVRSARAVVVGQDIFGIPAKRGPASNDVNKICGSSGWPVTWLKKAAQLGKRLTGTQLQAVSGAEVRPLRLDGRMVGTVYEDEHARYCRLGDIKVADASLPRERQAREVFALMERALGAAEMSFLDIVRTGFYLDNILAWYDDFNKVRTEFFTGRRVFDNLVPVSTGIGSGNAAGAAVVANALAIRPFDKTVRIFVVPSPLQCPALMYGSSFSRAMEIAGTGWRRLLVSGTASIEPGGKSAYPGDAEKQIGLTMDVVKAILDSRRMSWRDVTRAVVHLRRGGDAEVFARFCARQNLPPLPSVIVESVICREELLFEIELEAAVEEA